MRNVSRYFTLLAATTAALIATMGGCVAIGASIDCEQMCDQLETCMDGDLNVGRCIDRCEDQAEDSRLRKRLDQCTDCLDRGYACAEITRACPVCEEVTDALL
jgi:type II secretory pathway component PulF